MSRCVMRAHPRRSPTHLSTEPRVQWPMAKRSALMRSASKTSGGKHIHASWSYAPPRGMPPVDVAIDVRAALGRFTCAVPCGADWSLKAYGVQLTDLTLLSLGKPSFVVCSKDGRLQIASHASTPLSLKALQWAFRHLSWRYAQMPYQCVNVWNVDLALTCAERETLDRDCHLLPRFEFDGIRISTVHCDAALVKCVVLASALCAPFINVRGVRADHAIMPRMNTRGLSFQHGALDVSRATASNVHVSSDEELDLRVGSRSLPSAGHEEIEGLEVDGTIQPSALMWFTALTKLDCHIATEAEAAAIATVRGLRILTVWCKPTPGSTDALRAILKAAVGAETAWPELVELDIHCLWMSAAGDEGCPGDSARTCMHVGGVSELVLDATRDLRARGVFVAIHM